MISVSLYFKSLNKMATTIKITPVIQGIESKKFNDSIATSKSNKISEDKKAKIFSLVNRIIAKKV